MIHKKTFWYAGPSNNCPQYLRARALGKGVPHGSSRRLWQKISWWYTWWVKATDYHFSLFSMTLFFQHTRANKGRCWQWKGPCAFGQESCVVDTLRNTFWCTFGNSRGICSSKLGAFLVKRGMGLTSNQGQEHSNPNTSWIQDAPSLGNPMGWGFEVKAWALYRLCGDTFVLHMFYTLRAIVQTSHKVRRTAKHESASTW